MNKFYTLLFLLGVCYGQRTADKMYDPINAISACFRRLNGTHQTGCSSDREGSTGVVHFVESEADVDFVLGLNNGLNYIPAIPARLFNKPLLKRLQSAGHINGILVYDVKGDKLDYFSNDQKCPNRESNLEGTCSVDWNTHGTGLLIEDITIPLFYVNCPIEEAKVRECFNTFNNYSFEQHTQRSLCSIELQSFMFAAHSTPTCLRRSHSVVNMNPVKFCDPLGDQNVWASLFPMGNSSLTPDAQIEGRIKHILVVARMDTVSLFHNVEPGAHSSVTGLVTLMSTAELLKRMIPKYENYDRNVVFIIFNGESFDYIGSQRVVFDIERNAFPNKEFADAKEHTYPIRMEDIEFVFEINQISKGAKNLHLHMMNEADHRNFLNIIKKHLDVNVHTGIIPPTSIQSFARVENQTPAALVLTDYEKTFSNPFYNSIYDNSKGIKFKYHNMSDDEDFDVLPKDSLQVYIGDTVDGLAKSLYEVVTRNNYTGDMSANLYYVNELLHCYLENTNCSIHRSIRKAHFQQAPLSRYVSVTVSYNTITSLLTLTMAFFIGDKIGEGPCPSSISSHVYYHFNMSESVSNRTMRCYRTSLNITDAESPAFLIQDYDWSSGQYSSWTESVWREFNVRLFLKPARSHEILTISLGTTIFVLSLCMTMFINLYKDMLFGELSTVTPPTNC